MNCMIPKQLRGLWINLQPLLLIQTNSLEALFTNARSYLIILVILTLALESFMSSSVLSMAGSYQRESLILHDFFDLSWLVSEATKLDEFINKKEKRRWAQLSNSQTMLSIIEDVFEGENEEQASDVTAAEIVARKAYVSLAIKPWDNKEGYSFDITQANKIFDHLLKEKKIKPINKQKLPPADEIKNKKYCKWHNSFSHQTNNCIVFRNAIKKAIQEKRFKSLKKRAKRCW